MFNTRKEALDYLKTELESREEEHIVWNVVRFTHNVIVCHKTVVRTLADMKEDVDYIVDLEETDGVAIGMEKM